MSSQRVALAMVQDDRLEHRDEASNVILRLQDAWLQVAFTARCLEWSVATSDPAIFQCSECEAGSAVAQGPRRFPEGTVICSSLNP